MILLDKYFALEKADNQYQLGIIDEQTKISIIKFLNSLPSAQSDNGYSDGFADGYKRGLTSAQPEKLYTKADYIMALHKEYGCSLTRAEEAHNKALEYLQDEMMMKGGKNEKRRN